MFGVERSALEEAVMACRNILKEGFGDVRPVERWRMSQLGKNGELDGNGVLLYEIIRSATSMLFYMRGARYKNSIALHDWPDPPLRRFGSAHQANSRGGSFDGPHFASLCPAASMSQKVDRGSRYCLRHGADCL